MKIPVKTKGKKKYIELYPWKFLGTFIGDVIAGIIAMVLFFFILGFCILFIAFLISPFFNELKILTLLELHNQLIDFLGIGAIIGIPVGILYAFSDIKDKIEGGLYN